MGGLESTKHCAGGREERWGSHCLAIRAVLRHSQQQGPRWAEWMGKTWVRNRPRGGPCRPEEIRAAASEGG